jgi:hypothetical protein
MSDQLRIQARRAPRRFGDAIGDLALRGRAGGVQADRDG